MDSMGPAELGIVVLVALILLAAGLTAKKGRGFGAWLKMFFFGAVLIEAYIVTAGVLKSSALAWSHISAAQHGLLILRGGISAVLLYGILRGTVSRLSAATFPLFWLFTWYVQRIVDSGLYLLSSRVRGPLPESVLAYYSSLSHWLVPSISYPYFLLDAISAALIVGATYYLCYGSLAAIGSHASSGRSDYGGSTMSADDTTRLLCASAFLSGQQFRRQVLDHFEDKNRAFAPEIGLDVSLLAQVCQFAENRERRYTWLFLLAAILGLAVGLMVSPEAGIVVGVLFSAGVYLQKAAQERDFVRRYYQRGRFNPAEVKGRFRADLHLASPDALAETQQNLIVYQGFTPFVGAGINLGGWSFTVDIDKAAESDLLNAQEDEPVPFETEDLYADIDEEIRSLRLERLTIGDYCFVNGAEIREDQRILADVFGRPRRTLDDAIAEGFKKTSDPRIRHYQWIRVHDWGNDLVLSYFLRCALRGSSLFVEINRFLLTPLFSKYRSADSIAKPRFAARAGEFITAFIVGPLYAVASPFLIPGRLNEGLEHLFDTKNRKRRREIEDNPLFNYGASASLRYTFSSDSFSHYFQKLDGDFYTKVLEHQILDAIVDFLDDHNIDTSEIRERRTTILNSGVIVQGGDVKAESLAVGSGATAVKSASTPKKGRAGKATRAAA